MSKPETLYDDAHLTYIAKSVVAQYITLKNQFGDEIDPNTLLQFSAKLVGTRMKEPSIDNFN